MSRRSRLICAWFSAAMLSVAAFSASAEGNCPPGHYPIGGQGVRGCAPIPGYRGGAQAGPSQAPPVDPGRYEDRWGAIALSNSTPDAGAVVDERDQASAESAAIAKCSRNGVKDCRIIMHYRNQCAAWVVPSAGAGAKVGLGNGLTEQAAITDATQKCVGGTCTLAYSGCSLPKWTR